MNPIEINLEIVVPTHTRYLGVIGNIAEQLVQAVSDYPGNRDLLAYHLNLALTEAIANAIEHAAEDDPQKKVRVMIQLDGNNLCIQVHDQGRGFDLTGVPSANPEELRESGRGIFCIRAIMDTVDYRRTEEGNVLEMRKNLGS